MNKSLKIFLPIVIIGLVAMIGYKAAEPFIAEYQKTKSSDASDIRQTIRIGVDSWIGYVPLCSRDFKKRMRNNGYLIKCIDDKANYQSRYGKLDSGDLEFAVGTVDSYLLNAKDYDFPGTIISVIDESKGGDAIVADKSRFKNLEDLKAAKNLKVAFTPDSPSEHLFHATAVHFDMASILSGQYKKIRTDGAENAFDSLKRGKADVAVLWEPFVSRATALGYQTILTSKDTQKLIVDVLIVGRKFAQKEPDTVNTLLRNYFRTLKFYRDNQSELVKEIQNSTKEDEETVKTMMEGVSWQTLSSNSSKWFGLKNTSQALSREYLVDTIDSAVDILTNAKKISSHPLPDENPYIILNRKFVEELYRGGVFVKESGSDTDRVTFTSLSDREWDNLADIGSLKIRPITFQSGTSEISEEGKLEIKKLASNLSHYPNFRIVVRGHTGTRGDAQANLTLSQSRADSVRDHLVNQMSIQNERIRAVGLGSTKPLAKKPGESSRAYNYRLPRVEINLAREVY